MYKRRYTYKPQSKDTSGTIEKYVSQETSVLFGDTRAMIEDMREQYGL